MFGLFCAVAAAACLWYLLWWGEIWQKIRFLCTHMFLYICAENYVSHFPLYIIWNSFVVIIWNSYVYINLSGHFACISTFKQRKQNKEDITVYIFTPSWTGIAGCDEIQTEVPKFLNRKTTQITIYTISINFAQ